MARFVFEHANSVDIPFNLVGNLIMLEVHINDRPEKLSFLFATSFEETILSRKTLQKLAWEDLYIEDISTEMGKFAQDVIRNASLSLIGFRSISQRIPVWDIDLGNDARGNPVDGILGMDWMEQNVVTLDYGRRTLTFRKPHVFTPEPGDESIPLEITGQKPYIPVKLNGYFETNAVIDTGSSGQIYTIEEDGLKGDVVTLEIGKYAMQTPYSVTDLDENFLDEGAHILGSGLLKQFVLTFHLGERKIYFRKIDMPFWMEWLKRFRLISNEY